MRSPLLLLAVLAAAAVGVPAASAAPAGHGDHDSGPSVAIYATAYGVAKIDVLAGDTVTWRNDSGQAHTVSALDGSFSSTKLSLDGTFAHRFDATGAVGYFCSIHPLMRAEVDVHRLLLDAPHDASAPGQALTIGGRAALPAGSSVSIEDGAGAVAGAGTVGDDGMFDATVRPRVSTAYRAVAGADASPPVQVLVLDRKVKAYAGRGVVRATVVPASHGATVVLQMRLRERFGWWPVQRATVDHHSRARFKVSVKRRVRARVVLLARDGATPLARSAVFRIRPR